MSATRLLLATSALVAFAPTLSWAQSADPERLPTVKVEDDRRATASYRFGDPLDSGTSTIEREAIETNTPGSGDVNQLLKALPTVQFSLDERAADEASLQDIRPEQLSISGGRPYDNLFLIDGIGVNSQVDTSNANPFNLFEVAGASPQTVWFDSTLVGSVTVRDSNVSARFGDFTGGVVEIETRDPARSWGVNASYSMTTTDLTSFTLSDAAAEALEGDLPPEPQYEKTRWGLSVDAPVTDAFRLLLGYNHSRSEVIYQRGVSYGSGLFGQSSVSDNFLVKADADLPRGMNLNAQVSYSPYESEASSANGINNQIVSNGGGLVTSAELSGTRGEGVWSVKAGYSTSSSDRDAPEVNYSRPSEAPSVDYCTSTNCTEGGFGTLRQRQNRLTLSGDYETPIGSGDLAMGLEAQRIEAQRQRPNLNYAYQSGAQTRPLNPSVSPLTLCRDGNDETCVTGEYALMLRQVYLPFDAQVDISGLGLWSEYRWQAGGFDIRLGARYDYETFLGNHNLSPRLSVARDLPFGLSGTLGLNRYYGRSFLGYALREQNPDNVTERRNAQIIAGRRVFTNDSWFRERTSRTATYSNADLSTPYSDEVTVALSGGLFGGDWRARGIVREGRDEFARSPAERLVYNPVTGGSSTFVDYTLTNDGETSYRGLSLEYNRAFGRHSVFASTSLSETKTNAENYFENDNEDLFGGTFVVYQGEVVSLLDVLSENQRLDFASPFIVNGGVNSTWWDGRVTTSLNARFRDGFEQIADTGDNAVVDGTRYDVYDIVEYEPSVTFNLNASIDLLTTANGAATLDVRIDNLLDSIPNNDSRAISQPYQLGRVVWLGLKYRY